MTDRNDDAPMTNPAFEAASMPRLARSVSILAGVLGAAALGGAIIAIASAGAQAYILEGDLEWWTKISAVTIYSETVVGFVALAALLVDRTRSRMVAVAGLLAWAAAKVLIAVDQLQLYDSLR